MLSDTCRPTTVQFRRRRCWVQSLAAFQVICNLLTDIFKKRLDNGKKWSIGVKTIGNLVTSVAFLRTPCWMQAHLSSTVVVVFFQKEKAWLKFYYQFKVEMVKGLEEATNQVVLFCQRLSDRGMQFYIQCCKFSTQNHLDKVLVGFLYNVCAGCEFSVVV